MTESSGHSERRTLIEAVYASTEIARWLAAV